MTMFVELFHTARMEGLGVTLHVAEVRIFFRAWTSLCVTVSIPTRRLDEAKLRGGDDATPKL
jgi:hypothetical protein